MSEDTFTRNSDYTKMAKSQIAEAPLSVLMPLLDRYASVCVDAVGDEYEDAAIVMSLLERRLQTVVGKRFADALVTAVLDAA